MRKDTKTPIHQYARHKFVRIALFLLLIATMDYGLCTLDLFAQDKIIAIVNNDIITQKDLNDFINFMRVQLSTEYKGRTLENKVDSIKFDLLSKLIEDRLILQEAKRDNIKISPDRVKDRIDEIRRRYGSEGEFQSSLAKQGLVQADVEEKIREQLLMYSVIDKKIKSKISIKPGDVTDFYKQNIQKFVSAEKREFESLTVGDKNVAVEILNKLRTGGNLKDLAREHSLTINNFICAKDGQLKRDIEETLFKMNTGEVSPPIKIEYDYYIFKLNDIIPSRQLTLSEVQNDIHAILFNNRMQEELMKWLDELRGRSYINILQG